MAQGVDEMVSVALENNRHCFFYPADSISSCNLILLEKAKGASFKCLFDKSFLNTVAFSTPLIEKVVSHPVRACRNRSLVLNIRPHNYFMIISFLQCYELPPRFTFCYF